VRQHWSKFFDKSQGDIKDEHPVRRSVNTLYHLYRFNDFANPCPNFAPTIFDT
jgi:hypothetical protein